MRRFLLLLCLTAGITVNGQIRSGTTFQSIIDVSPKSPEVASLGKFGEIPVSYATGVPSITVPVFNINIGKINIPISLDYHAGGVRIDEMASSVGLGWALSGIGSISRQMVGIPDEDQFGFRNAPSPDSVAGSPSTFYTYLYEVQKGLRDAEPDIYSYNINGPSGKFLYRRNGTFMQIPVTNNKIETGVGSNGLFYKITDENGIVYLFEKTTSTDMSVASGLYTYISSWRLTKMVDSNAADTIYFSYENSCSTSYQWSTNFTHYVGNAFTQCGPTPNWQFKNEQQTKTQMITLNEAYPKEINWRGGRISFINTCDRQDVTGSGMRLNEIIVYSNLNGRLKQVKRMKLYQSYFNSIGSEYVFTAASAEQKKRLRLDSVALLSVSGALSPQSYRMTYDTSKLAPRESYAQDRWGFNNGAWGNVTLIPAQNIYFWNTYYNIGSANREPDSDRMKAGTITSIEYPTKGKTVFEFEPHAFQKYETQVQDISQSASCTGNVQSTNTKIFTVDADNEDFKYSAYISAFAGKPVTDRPRIILTDQTTGSQIFFISTPVGQESSSYQVNDVGLSLVAGHTYNLTVNIYSSSPDVSANCVISYTKNLGDVLVTERSGGLRVKTITNYDLDGKFLDREKYEYAPGTMLTDQYYRDLNYEQIMPRGAGANCFYMTIPVPPNDALIFHANSVLPVSQFSGSPLLYPLVTRYEVDSLDVTNGKTEYGYNVYTDQTEIANLPVVRTVTFNTIGIFLTSNSWKNNKLAYENTYKRVGGNYSLISTKRFNYSPYRETLENSLKIKNIYLTTCCQEVNSTTVYANEDFALTSFPNRSGVMLLTNQSDTTWDDSGNKISTFTEYKYDDLLHTLPTMQNSWASDGELISDSSIYPSKLAASGNVYQKMVNRNILSHVVKNIRQKGGRPVLLANTNYTDWNNDGKLLLPMNTELQIGSNPIETRIRYNKFDLYGNIQEQQKENDIKQSYVWGYDTLYPIATVSNAAQTDIAYTSFEPDAAGYWTIPSSVRDTTQAITGNQCYALGNGAVSRSGLSTTNSFVVSYWSKSGSASVNGGSGTLVTTKKGWNYYEHRLNAGISTVTVSGAITIDELRVYPAAARMVSVCYEPLVGMTSQSDAVGRITYYEYDGFGRLKVIRDNDGQVLKVVDYQYSRPITQ
ncbi:RHS repeat domain-containing protein [Chitinophaga sp. CF418]|uniref:RHS repeat domain-containing protein n=1 Tax=Chitinophaga sp. CF418 TaxID=1855287 RepID=UPI0009231DBB|nr:RHS repeat domain-containing protein [Chitinophaga sp. CF418]SHN46127.1 YD repeat-containing protein [Chitinophaga sp. CF418]